MKRCIIQGAQISVKLAPVCGFLWLPWSHGDEVGEVEPSLAPGAVLFTLKTKEVAVAKLAFTFEHII